MIAEARLRSGKAASGRAAARQVKQALTTARACAAGTIMPRGDSAFGTKKVIATCVAEGVEFSLSVSRNRRINAAIDEAAYAPVHYPGAVQDPDTGALISAAEVAETPYTLRLGRGKRAQRLTARLVVRRVKDARYVCHERETEVLM